VASGCVSFQRPAKIGQHISNLKHIERSGFRAQIEKSHALLETASMGARYKPWSGSNLFSSEATASTDVQCQQNGEKTSCEGQF
jgi:hypothetical protein